MLPYLEPTVDQAKLEGNIRDFSSLMSRKVANNTFCPKRAVTDWSRRGCHRSVRAPRPILSCLQDTTLDKGGTDCKS